MSIHMTPQRIRVLEPPQINEPKVVKFALIPLGVYRFSTNGTKQRRSCRVLNVLLLYKHSIHTVTQHAKEFGSIHDCFPTFSIWSSSSVENSPMLFGIIHDLAEIGLHKLLLVISRCEYRFWLFPLPNPLFFSQIMSPLWSALHNASGGQPCSDRWLLSLLPHPIKI